MSLLPPPRLALEGNDLPSVVRALTAYQQYVYALYNAARPVILRVEQIGEVAQLEALTQTISDPPTQVEVQAIQAAVNLAVTAINSIITAAQATVTGD